MDNHFEISDRKAQHKPRHIEGMPSTATDDKTEEMVLFTTLNRWPLRGQQGPLTNLVTLRSTTSHAMGIAASVA